MPDANSNAHPPRLSHWRELLDQFDAPTLVEDYELTLAAIAEQFELHGPESFDFSCIDPATCSLEHLAAALRFTFSHQKSIPT